jgi:hypothetical protein
VKTDSGAYATLKASKAFALNMLGKGQGSIAFAFFKPAQVADGKISGHEGARREGVLRRLRPSATLRTRAALL